MKLKKLEKIEKELTRLFHKAMGSGDDVKAKKLLRKMVRVLEKNKLSIDDIEVDYTSKRAL